MILAGFFQSCGERTYQKKDGTEGKSIECMFQVAGERDVIRLSTWSSRGVEWLQEHGITTGAAGEVNVRFGNNNYGWYEQVILGFKPQLQIEKEKAEAQKKEDAMKPQEKTPEMQAAAEDMLKNAAEANKGAGDKLPF